MIAVALGFGAAAAPALAQRTTYTNFNSWYALGADIALPGPWSVLVDLQNRRSGPLRQTQSLFLRPALIYAVNSGVKLGLGISRSESFPYGEIPSAYHTPEWRLFEQLQLSHTVSRIAVSHRYRLEQRWLGRRGADTADHAIAQWNRASRFRYQVRGVMPLKGGTIDDHEPYATGYNELMIGFGRGVALNVFDQNRTAVGLGWRHSRSWRAEAGFLEQVVLKANGRDVERNHTLTFGLYYTRHHEAVAAR
jgi:hypothetical protein